MPSARPGAAESISNTIATGAHSRVLVRTVTGLEFLAAAELTDAGHRLIDMSTRQLVIDPTSANIITSPPRLADDLFLIGADVPDPGRTKADLSKLARALRRELTVPLLHWPGEAISVSASFLGRRTYSRFDIEDLSGQIIAEQTGGHYHSRRDGSRPPRDRADWRVVLDGTRARVAMRPFDAPLHRRDWRTRTVTGSLHPPVAAALARLARIEPGHRVLDPFCGAGTILLEAHRTEPEASYIGIDRDSIAINAARANTDQTAGIVWRTGDARTLEGWLTGVDRIVTNPPWQVRLDIDDFSSHMGLWHHQLQADGLLVAIVNQSQAQFLRDDARWQVDAIHEIAVAGQHPRIVVARPTA
ncbi:methyltransferase domain-containing protein [Georgenia sp. TF02-10]|uniref:TRM11 family SAM-dependent methyltransferase n=1 Tax=Georgenia sp. TF02-10 TaxID=2917725 RepID=UPI001FA6EDDE|nr:methyltransferase domain-containing protein [Georgenia sp. TF02-10]UNX54264.1 methyltransferase domain-containing protein [Georgenia sp. TF02-10]